MRASPAQDASQHKETGIFYAMPISDLAQLPCQISQVIPVLDSDRSIRRVKLVLLQTVLCLCVFVFVATGQEWGSEDGRTGPDRQRALSSPRRAACLHAALVRAAIWRPGCGDVSGKEGAQVHTHASAFATCR